MRADEAIFANILALVDVTQWLHAKVMEYGCSIHSIVYYAVITAYSQCGPTDDVENMFEEINGARDLVTWNSLIAAYAFCGLTKHAVNLFSRMQEVRSGQNVDFHQRVMCLF